MTDKLIKIGVSSCLLGEKVRYDGGHKNDTYIACTLAEYFQFIPFCPETSIGLGVPRDPIRLVNFGGDIRCVGAQDPSLDVTEKLNQCAEAQRHWHNELCGYLFKKDSPSCGMEHVKVFSGTTSKNAGSEESSGLYAKRLMENFPLLPCEEEGRLGNAILRENFIQRVYIYHRWKSLQQEDFTADKLMQFHSQHKLIAMSHDQNAAHELGRIVASSNIEPLSQVAANYIALLMPTLKQIATQDNHANVLQHVQGYLKKQLNADDKKELSEAIENYRQGDLPLIIPLTLLKHHFRKSPDHFIDQSYYMSPSPAELKLTNTL